MVNLSQFDPSKLGTNETLSLLAEVERSLAKIRENADSEAVRAEEAARLARDMKSLEDERAKLLERQLTLESQVATATANVASLESRLGAAHGNAKDLESQLSASRSQGKQLESELAEVKKAGDALAADVRGLKSRIGLLEAQLAEARKAKQSVDTELDAARKAQKSTDTELGKAQKSIERLEGESAKAKEQAKALESELAKSREHAKSLDAALGESRTSATRLERQLDESKSRTSALEGELAAAHKKAVGLEKTIVELRAGSDSLASQLESTRAAAATFEKQLGEAKVAQEKLRAELADARGNATKTQQALDAAKTDAKRLGDDLAQANAACEKASAERTAAEAARAKADAERERAEAELNEAAGFTKQFASEIAALKLSAKRLEKELNESKSAASRLEGEVGQAKSASAKLEQELAQAKAAAAKASAEVTAARSSAASGDGELRAARQAITTLESEVATARRTVDELRKQADSARSGVANLESALKKAESERNDAEELARMAEQECTRIAGEAKSARESMQHEHARALEQAQATARGAFDQERGRIQSLEKERDDAFARLKAAETRIGQITSLADSQAEQILGLEEQIADARKALDDVRAAASANTNPGHGPSLAEIETLAEQRVTALLQPKLEQLAQAASFLRIRRERLSALRLGLKRKSKALKAAQRTPAAYASATAPVANEAIEAERVELARERQEILDLRVMLHASEESVARRAAGNRFLTLATLCSAMLGLAALCAWHVSGAVVSPPVLATVDLEVTSRMQDNRFENKSEPKSDATEPAGTDGAAAETTPADAAALAAPIATLIKERISDPVWAGLVSARLAERGRTRAESDALVQDLANRVAVTAEGGSVHLSLRGEGELATRTTLDAIAMTAVGEANRDPARRADYLRVGIANAKQEVGRTVFSVADTLPDPKRWGRAGAILGMTTLVAIGFVGIAMLLSRRPQKPAETPTAAL